MAALSVQQQGPESLRRGAALRRLVPPLAFLAALCVLVVCFYDSGYTSLPPTGKRYEQAKAGVEGLRQDEKRARLREPWEKLAMEFRAIYEGDPGWPNRPAALFRAAEALEELARHSFARPDARKAVECYETLAQRHADSRLADDALFRAARLRAAWLKDDKGALNLLRRLKAQYPKGDMLPEALALEKTLVAASLGRTAPEARQVAAADARPVVDEPEAQAPAVRAGTGEKKRAPATRPLPATATLAERAAAMRALPASDLLPRYREAKARLASLRGDKVRAMQRQPWEDIATEFLRIYQARKDWAIAPGALFRAADSLEGLAGRSGRQAEYRQARDLFLTLAQEFPKSALADDALLRAATINAERLGQKDEALELLDGIAALYADGDMAAQAGALRAALAPGKGRPSAAPAARPARRQGDAASLKGRMGAGLASQLGLTVRTVFIDAGHGGRDPGTSHNGVLEREVSLDVAMTVGRLLRANGLEVVFSRTRNTEVPLRQRTAMANAAGTDLFVSIHVNANANASVHGLETYYLNFARNPEAARVAMLENAAGGQRLGDMRKMLADVMLNARVDESRSLATDIQRRTLSRLKRRKYAPSDNGVKSAPFLVLLGAQMPAVLVELGYCTHPGEARNLLNSRYRMALAEGIAEGIMAYRDKLLRQRTVQNALTPDEADAI